MVNFRRVGMAATAIVAAFALFAAACTSDDDSSDGSDEAEIEVNPDAVEQAHYILPPGNYGGLPATEHSLDQLPLYSGLSPLRDNVTQDDLGEYFLPQNFEPIGETTEEETGREGVEILYDEWGVPHITGETREDMAFGAGWASVRDRGLLFDLGRGPARAAVVDVPGLDAFGLVTSAQEFIPSEAAEQLVSDQVDLIRSEYGEEGDQIIADATAYAEGVNAYWEANGIDQAPATVNDVIAVTAFIGSIFGAGGGAEAANADLLATIQAELGDETGQQAWDDVMLFLDPEAPTTIDETFDYPVLTGGDVEGSVEIDAGSIVDTEPVAEAAPEAEPVLYKAAGGVPVRQASNWQLVERAKSANGTTLGVMGPQLGYYYPPIVQQMHLKAPGIDAQGAVVPGLSMYLLIGRTQDYAWSLTSASHDVRDVYAEVLCNPDGSEATRESTNYEFEGECVPFEQFNAGTLNGQPVTYPVSIHGPVIGTATSDGKPVALTRQRSTFGRDGLNLAALKAMTEGQASDAEAFYEVANRFGFTFNWAYINREGPAFFSSGYLPDRPEGLDRRLPTLGNGEWEWTGYLSRDEHPHADGHESGLLLNWNNQSAPGFMHGDDDAYGSMHRVELFTGFGDEPDLPTVVGVMNKAATQYPVSQPWPTVSSVLSGGDAPSEAAAGLATYLDDWLEDDAPAVDADEDGKYDTGGPAIMDALWEPLIKEIIRPVFGDVTDTVYTERGLSNHLGWSIADKDLRTLLGEDVEGPFNLSYCGEGDLEVCRESLWAVIETVATELSEEYASADPGMWLRETRMTSFVPGLIPEEFPTTNRPTYQQALELLPSSGD